jgi:hypothetical protein
MSNWGYVGLAYGVTYVVLVAYTIYLFRARSRATDAVQSGKRTEV